VIKRSKSRWYDQDKDLKNLLEQKVQERTKELEQMYKSYRIIFENSGTAIIIVDQEMRITLANTEFEKWSGYAQDDIIGRKWTEFSPPDINNNENLESFDYMQEMGNSSVPLTFESRGIDKWGVTHDLLITISHIPGMRRNVISFLNITDRKQAENSIRSMAYYDILTGLPNRKLYEERLAQEISRCSQEESMLAVMFLDLDGFKRVNDSYGHEVGDKLLIEVGTRLLQVLREDDVVSRLGGDEFTIILTNLRYVKDADHMVSRIFKALKPSVVINRHEIMISTSIGISLFPANGDTTELLIKKADSAMYQAKKRAHNNYQIYNEIEI